MAHDEVAWQGGTQNLIGIMLLKSLAMAEQLLNVIPSWAETCGNKNNRIVRFYATPQPCVVHRRNQDFTGPVVKMEVDGRCANITQPDGRCVSTASKGQQALTS